jgi:hypothetical protein
MILSSYLNIALFFIFSGIVLYSTFNACCMFHNVTVYLCCNIKTLSTVWLNKIEC